MFMLITVGLLSQILLVVCQPTVIVEQGEIFGKTEHFESDYLDIQNDVDVYFGIPYAEPPVGERRFAAPIPKEPWGDDEVYNATYYRDICMQAMDPRYSQSEDCLHLNVFRPRSLVSDNTVELEILEDEILFVMQ